MPSTYRYKPLQNGSNIRLIILFPARFDDDINIFIHESEFDKQNPPGYESLSYACGSEDDRKVVNVVHEGIVLVTQNLFSALKHLRREAIARILWIDALAIDQSNSEEKSTQVAMMGEIYRLASRVVAWLGPEESDSNKALKVMADIGSQVQVDWSTKTLRPASADADPSMADRSTELTTSRDDVLAIKNLLSRRWFERLWIRQEVFLANSQARVQCGYQYILWTKFRDAMVCLRQKPVRLDCFSPELSERLVELQGFILQKENVALWDLREDFSRAKCKDPRDRIYAIISMLYEGDRRSCPSPDYSKPFMEVYKALVLRWLSIYGSLELLRECELYDGAPGPSWVPDWSQGATASLRGLPLMASSNLGAWYEKLEPQVLRVVGVSNSVVTEALDIPFKHSSQLDHIYRWVHELLVTQNLDGHYVSGYSLVEAYARTLLCDGIADDMDPAGDVWLNIEAAKLVIQHIHSKAKWSPHKFGYDAPVQLFLQNVLRIRGKKFIKCDNGYIGIAPPLTRSGDQVCVLLGCRAPMILRPIEDEKFILVGESFVCGLSTGEGLLGPLPADIRVAKVIQNAQVGYAMGFVNGSSSTVSFVDPRLEALSLDLEEFRNRSNQNGNALFFLDPEVLRKHGVNIKYFDLK